MAALKQTLQAKNILKLGEFIEIFNRNVETNMDMSQVKDYLPYIIGFNTENITTGALPGVSEKIDKTDGSSIWIFVHNKKQAEKLIGELFLNKPTAEELKENSNINIQLLYIKDKEENAQKLEKELKEQGYKITKEEIAAAPKTIIINRKQLDEKQIQNIKSYVVEGITEDGEDTGNYNCTIIIGKDYK